MPTVLAVFTVGFQAFGQTKPTVTKSWKEFKSKFGYEFKYPDCWQVQIGDVDAGYDGPPEGSPTLGVSAGPECSGSLKGHGGISFDGGLGPKGTKARANKRIARLEKDLPVEVQRGWAALKYENKHKEKL